MVCYGVNVVYRKPLGVIKQSVKEENETSGFVEIMGVFLRVRELLEFRKLYIKGFPCTCRENK
jgi:hypothetical protein